MNNKRKMKKKKKGGFVELSQRGFQCPGQSQDTEDLEPWERFKTLERVLYYPLTQTSQPHCPTNLS
jgi:hypothetical protein